MSEINFETWVKELADAIRTKKGTSDKIKALDYKQEILSIETGASGEPIIIETEEEFNALLENATQEDDGKIYLYNDNLYKLNYNETTTSRTLEIVANGEYDVALYDKVNVQVQSESSGATIEVLGATPIPNDSYVETIKFNTDLSVDEVVSILSGITMNLGNQEALFVNEDMSIIVAVMSEDGLYALSVTKNDEPQLLFCSDLTVAELFGVNFVGWNPDFNGIVEINASGMPTLSIEGMDLPIGSQNEQLVNLCYVEGEAKSKTLSGTYDGSSIDIIENGVVDVETLIDEGKIPLKVNVDVDKSSTLRYLAQNVGYPILEHQNLLKVYINTKRDASKLLNIVKELPYTFYVSNLDTFGYLIAQNNGDSKWLAILKIENSYGQTYYQLQTSDDKVLWIGYIIPQEDGTIQEGGQWGGIDDEGSYSELELNWVVEKTGGYNELLSDYISSVAFREFYRTKKIQSGAYQGQIIEISENGLVDLSDLYDELKMPTRVNVNVEQVNVEEANIETTNKVSVPNSGYVDKIYFNTSLSNDSVVKLLETLTYVQTPFLASPLYPILFANDGNPVVFVLKESNSYEITVATDIANQVYEYVYTNANGWHKSEYSVGKQVIANYNGISVGEENSEIANLVSTSPNFGKNIGLKGTYDGASVSVTENGVVDIESMLGEKKLPLSLEVNVASSGEDMLQTRVDLANSCAYLMYQFKGSNVDFISNLDTSNVTDMSYMFAKCTNLPTILLLNTSNVTNMERMFDECRSLTTIPLLNTSEVTNMNNMFYSCNKLTSLPQLDTSKVTNMSGMFSYCSQLTAIPQLDTSKVIRMSSMFSYCSQLTAIPQLDTSKVTYMNNMFTNCSSLTTISQLDTSSVTTMDSMFNYCTKLETIQLLDMRSVTNAGNMFYNCQKLTNLTLKNIKVKLQIGSGTSWGHLLTLESLLNTCQECINMNKSLTLTMGSANLEKLASVYVKLTGEAEEDETLPKLPMVQCESSDEGAMSVTDYMALKNWTLA